MMERRPQAAVDGAAKVQPALALARPAACRARLHLRALTACRARRKSSVASR